MGNGNSSLQASVSSLEMRGLVTGFLRFLPGQKLTDRRHFNLPQESGLFFPHFAYAVPFLEHSPSILSKSLPSVRQQARPASSPSPMSQPDHHTKSTLLNCIAHMVWYSCLVGLGTVLSLSDLSLPFQRQEEALLHRPQKQANAVPA